jgi:hypothetical protein
MPCQSRSTGRIVGSNAAHDNLSSFRYARIYEQPTPGRVKVAAIELESGDASRGQITQPRRHRMTETVGASKTNAAVGNAHNAAPVIAACRKWR